MLCRGGLQKEGERGWGAKNPGPICRIKVSQDVPRRQPKTKLGGLRDTSPKLKADGDHVLVFHFGFNKKV